MVSTMGTLAVVHPAAHAQSSVSLYGVVDEGLDYTSNVQGHSQWKMSSGDAQGSRWGVKGSEDLGGGYKAVFQLENGFDVNNGRLMQGGRMFGRQAYVGVSNDSYGTVSMGRQYDSLVEFLAPLTANANWGGYLFEHPYDNDNTDNSFRLNNAVQYYSANFGGFQFGATYAFSNTPGQISTNNAQSVGASYTNGGLSLALAYLNVTNPGGNSAGAVATDNAAFFAERQRVFGAGFNYALGNATVGFVYSHTDLRNPVAYSYISGSIVPPGQSVSSLKFDNFEVSGTYHVTPAFMLGAMYDFTQAKLDASGGSSKPKWHTVGLMADYNLSKRTDVYVMASVQKAESAHTGTAFDFAYGGADDSSSSDRQTVARIGLRHKF
ncbi:porin [Paraburkholderia sp. RG36]|uniref:Porin n=2 Tax=Paraburkholderia tagetis TaxID=2913261 RepID=A0A9X1RVQ8_9BURK|nr:porin [Paraburkholderia tagetis]MCG5076787.1 porin [Paraburkholderia tagetis]